MFTKPPLTDTSNSLNNNYTQLNSGLSLPELSDPIAQNIKQSSSSFIQTTTIYTDLLNIPLHYLEPGNTRETAWNLGSISNQQSFNNFVGNNDTNDYFRISIGANSNLNLSLTGLSADLDLQLLDSNGAVISSSTRGSTNDESINLSSLAAGDYYVRVYQYSGDSNYSLRLSNTKPSNLLPIETNLGTLSGTRTFSDTVGNTDTTDTYRFSLGATSTTFNITLTGLSADADVRLIQDTNNNGFVDAGEAINTSSYGGTTSEWIGRALSAGNYLVQVSQYSGNTNYHLSISTGDWYSNNLKDVGIIGEARYFGADGQLGRNDMMAIFRNVKDGGVVDATEVTDLRRIQSSLGYMMPEHVRVLSNKIVNSDVANGSSGIGNLYAGSSDIQMERLIGKWFLGNDRPTANGTYRYTSGSLFKDGISYTDIDQGGVGDCYFLSGLAATAYRTPNTISSMFVDNGDDTYTVRFYNNGVADYVTVDRYLPTDSWGNRVYAGWGGNTNTNTNNELWVALAEKAYAQINQSGWLGRDNTNSYAGINYGNSYNTIRHITGRNTEGRGIPGASIFGIPLERATLINSFNEGRLITLGTKDFNLSNSNVIADHEYALVGYNSTTDKFKLFNPWGVDEGAIGVIELSWNELVGNFGYWNRTT